MYVCHTMSSVIRSDLRMAEIVCSHMIIVLYFHLQYLIEKMRTSSVTQTFIITTTNWYDNCTL